MEVRVEEVLREAFDARLQDPAAYQSLVDAEASRFPEGKLFPYALLVVAYANIGLADPAERPASRARIEVLVDALMVRVRDRFGDLSLLDDYGRNATWLGWTALALGCNKLIGGSDSYEPDRRHLVDMLHRALQDADGFPLASYPSLTWSFDTIPVLLALRLDDAINGANVHAKLIEESLSWQDENGDGPTGLPHSRLDDDRPQLGEAPRGSDLSLRIQLLAELDPPRARKTYERYVESHWLSRGGVVGFAEWPGGDGRADIDSGPIVFGMGMSATGMGLGAAQAAGDTTTVRALARELGMVRTLLPLLGEDALSGLPVDLDLDRYQTGFLYGDVALFASVTWADWGVTTRPSRDERRRTGGGHRQPR